MDMNLYLIDNAIDKPRGKGLKSLLSEINSNASVWKEVYIEKETCDYNPLIPNTYTECEECNVSKTYNTLTNPFILFIHTSNYCFYQFIKQIISQGDCWIVCYSGGGNTPPDVYDDLINSITEEEKSKIKYSPLSPNTNKEGIQKIWNLKAFVEAVINKEANPFDKLVRKASSHLIALSILCQGYLAAHGGEGLGEEWKKLTEKDSDLKEKVEGKKTDTENKAEWWKNVIGGRKNVEDELINIGDNNENHERIVKIKDLLDEIYKDGVFSNIGLVKNAYYDGLKKILKKTN